MLHSNATYRKGYTLILTRDGPTQWSEAPYAPRPSGAERIIAATAHFMTIFSVPGMLFATGIWFLYRKRSRYVAMQARQAVLWQTMGHIIVFSVIVLLLITAILAIGGSDANGLQGQIAGGSLVGSTIGLFLVPIGATVFFFASSLVGAFASLLGRKYTYPFIGRIAHRSVNPSADRRRLPRPEKDPRQRAKNSTHSKNMRQAARNQRAR